MCFFTELRTGGCFSTQICAFRGKCAFLLLVKKKERKKKALVLERAQDNACAYSILVCLGVCACACVSLYVVFVRKREIMHKLAQMRYFSVHPQTQTKNLGHGVIFACGLGSTNYGVGKQVNTICL